MQYFSTRDSARLYTDAQAIVSGLAPDGGLFLPMETPRITPEELASLCQMTYPQRAANIMARFLTSFSEAELLNAAQKAYARDRFPEDTAPLVSLDASTHILELFHGPTCAFKDFALQMLPHLLTASLQKTGITDTVTILVATSGDTGKAALEGFADVVGARIGVFYPDGGTSPMQRLQMTTQRGGNVMVCAVKGNFDDAQNGVKAIFSDKDYANKLKAQGERLSSANSINWGRLVPQVAYYVSAYCDLLRAGSIKQGESINICVPTGNFGNILAARYAKCMGLPVKRLICASNCNNVLTDFINTGVYDRNRPFHMTTSPSMDILISSNLERLLYLLSDDATVRALMAALKQSGRYELPAEVFAKLRAEFDCGCCDDAMAASTIRSTFEKQGYLADPHTAVALNVYEQYRARTGDATPVVIAATASPFKFCGSVLKALGRPVSTDDFAMLRELAALSGLTPPARLAALEGQAERFTGSVQPEEMQRVVTSFIEGSVRP